MSYFKLFMAFVDGLFAFNNRFVFVIPILPSDNLEGFIYIRFWPADRCYTVSYVFLDDDSFDSSYDDVDYPANIFYASTLSYESDLMDLENLRGYLDTFCLNYKKLYLSRFDIFNYHFEV